MDWIESEGGPLVLVDRELMRGWQGADGSADSRLTSDYERASAVDDFPEKLVVSVAPCG